MKSKLELFLVTIAVTFETIHGMAGRWNIDPVEDNLGPVESSSSMTGRWSTDPIEDNVISIEQIIAQPTSRPTAIKCTTDSSTGFYGDQSEEVVKIEFRYEVEIKSGSGKRVEDIVESLEIDFADSALPALFEDKCSPLLRRRGRKLNVIGMSTLPRDTIIDGAQCQVELTNVGNVCAVVDSGFTVYTSGNELDAQSMAMNAIQKANDDGYFTKNSDIARVTIMNSVIEQISDQNTNVNQRGTNGNDSSISATVYVVIVASALLIIGVAIVYRRRKRQSNVDVDSTVMTPSMPVQTTQDVDMQDTEAQEVESEGYDLRRIEK